LAKSGDETHEAGHVGWHIVDHLRCAALAYGGIQYTHQEKVLDIGPIHATREEHEQIPLPPLLGGMALVGGVALLVIGARQK